MWGANISVCYLCKEMTVTIVIFKLVPKSENDHYLSGLELITFGLKSHCPIHWAMEIQLALVGMNLHIYSLISTLLEFCLAKVIKDVQKHWCEQCLSDNPPPAVSSTFCSAFECGEWEEWWYWGSLLPPGSKGMKQQCSEPFNLKVIGSSHLLLPI